MSPVGHATAVLTVLVGAGSTLCIWEGGSKVSEKKWIWNTHGSSVGNNVPWPTCLATVCRVND